MSFKRPVRVFLRHVGTVTVLAMALSACQAANNETLASGKVVKVGKQRLILENTGSFLFVTLTDADRERLKQLKKGDKVTLVGKKETDEHNTESSEVDGLILEDGTRIPLGE